VDLLTTSSPSATPHDLFQHLLDVIASPRFLSREGIGSEVPFFICPYPPAQAAEMGRLERQLANQLVLRHVRVLRINLYDLCLELLSARGVLDRILEMEESIDKAQLKELLQGVLDTEHHLVPAIAARMAATDYDVLFITGVGEVFPYIRSHTILNNLQTTAGDRPLVLFFPGEYTHSPQGGASLDLFGRLHDDRYYRAFNLLHVSV
jgi:hypothetical protein